MTWGIGARAKSSLGGAGWSRGVRRTRRTPSSSKVKVNRYARGQCRPRLTASVIILTTSPVDRRARLAESMRFPDVIAKLRPPNGFVFQLRRPRSRRIRSRRPQAPRRPRSLSRRHGPRTQRLSEMPAGLRQLQTLVRALASVWFGLFCGGLLQFFHFAFQLLKTLSIKLPSTIGGVDRVEFRVLGPERFDRK